MKKAEELAEKYTEEKRKPWDLDACAQNACLNGFMAGYKAALSTKTDKVQMLLDTLEEISNRMPELSPEQECIGNRAIAALAIKSYYQTVEG